MSTVHIQRIGDHHSTPYESGLSNRTFEFRDQPRRVLIVEGGKAKLHEMMSETLLGQGFDVISVDEAGMINKANTSTCAATISPEVDRAHTAIERKLWNEAVDQRKAEKRARKWGAS